MLRKKMYFAIISYGTDLKYLKKKTRNKSVSRVKFPRADSQFIYIHVYGDKNAGSISFV